MSDKTIHNLLREGLISNNRNKIIKEMSNLQSSSEKTWAIAGLKDPQSKISDIVDIESGNHYKNYLQNNIKQDIINESNLLNDLKDENEDAHFNIQDSFGKEHDIQINVDLVKMFDVEIGDRKYGSLANVKSNDKIMQCLEIFNKLSLVDQQDIIDSLLLNIEYIQKKKDKKPTKKAFATTLNEQLNSNERQDFIGLLLAKAKNSYK